MKQLFVLFAATILMASCSGSSTSTETSTTDSTYQNIEIDFDDFTDKLESIGDYEPFTEKEVRKLIEYFLQYVKIGEMRLFNNSSWGEGEDIEIYGLKNRTGEYLYDVDEIPAFLVTETKPGFTILIVKSPDDWYYVSTDYNDDQDKCYKCDQLGGLFQFFDTELGDMEKRDVEREKNEEKIRQRLDDLLENLSDMSGDDLEIVDNHLDMLRSKLKK